MVRFLGIPTWFTLVIMLLFHSKGEDEATTKSFMRLNPSDWGGGWDRADEKVETAQLYIPLSAWFDDRAKLSLPILRTKLVEGATHDFDAYRTDKYVRILLAGQTEHLPSFYDNWDNKFIENMNKSSCQYFYEVAGKKASEHNVTVTVPILGIFPSTFDYRWFPASFSSPYAVYCPLPSPQKLGANLSSPSTNGLPQGVKLVPLNPNQGTVFIPISGGMDDVESILDALTPDDHNSTKVKLAVCIGPISGIDYLTNEYDDIDAMISLLSYYSIAGASHVYLYNPILTRDHVTAEAFHHWLHHLLYILKKGSRMGKFTLTVELVPDITRHRQRYYQTLSLDPELRKKTAYIYPTIFQETCNHLALKDKYSHLLIADYSDFLTIRNHAGGANGGSPDLVGFIAQLDQKNPRAAVYAFKTAIFPDLPVAGVLGDTDSAANSDSLQDESLFRSCRDRDTHLADLLCKTRRTDAFAADGSKFARTRVLVKPRIVSEVGHDGASPLAGYVSVDVDWAKAGIYRYLESTWIRTAANSQSQNASSRWALPAELDFSGLLRSHGDINGTQQRDTSMHAFRTQLLESPLYKYITHAFRPFELNHYSTLKQRVLHPNSTAWGQGAFGHPPQTAGAPSGVRRLLIFTSISPQFLSDGRFRRTQLAIASWLKLSSYRPKSLLVRVLLLSDDDDMCANLRRIHTVQGCSAHEEKSMPLNPFNLSHQTDSPTHRTHLHKFPHAGRNDTAPHPHLPRAQDAKPSPILCLPVTSCMHPIYGIPTVDCLFRTASAAAVPGEYLMYSNADVAFGSDLVDTLLALAEKNEFHDGFVGLGRRWNCPFEDHQLCAVGASSEGSARDSRDDPLAKELDASLASLQHLARSGSGHCIQDTSFAMDYFILHPNAVPRNLPPFLVGRANWDNLMTYWTLANSWGGLVPPEVATPNDTIIYFAGKGAVRASSVLHGPPVVSLSPSVFALHLGAVDSSMYEFSKRKGSDWAIRLLTDWKRIQFGNIDNSNYFLLDSCNASECTVRKRDYRPVYAPSASPTSAPTKG